MFRRLAAKTSAADVIGLHPVELMALLEQAWNARLNVASESLGHPNRRSDLSGLAIPTLPAAGLAAAPASTALFAAASPAPPSPFGAVAGVLSNAVAVQWDHLIYAYMIENTRIYEILRRVVHEFMHGEKLGVPRPATQAWLRNTEELFYRDPPPFSITTLSSHIRPDLRASRRNAYHRVFGMDLNHGQENGQPYPYVKVDKANTEFVSTFEELLREVWVGYTYRDTNNSANPTDDAKIARLAHALHDMLITRRQNGNLAREEFFYVSMMSWFHLTVESDLPIIEDLRATGASPEERLFKIAQAVGLPAHGLSRDYFEIADEISRVLIAIETGTLNTPGAARAFYDPAAASTLADLMISVITHWSTITGRDMKARKAASK
jgi:hypothetical protein